MARTTHRGLLANEARLLAALHRSKGGDPLWSAELRKEADSLRSDGRKTSHGALVRAMETLEDLGWVRATYAGVSEETPRKRPVVVYELTEEGVGPAQEVAEILDHRRRSQEVEASFYEKWDFPALAPNVSP